MAATEKGAALWPRCRERTELRRGCALPQIWVRHTDVCTRAVPWGRGGTPRGRRPSAGPGDDGPEDGGGPLAQGMGAIPWRGPLAQGTGARPLGQRASGPPGQGMGANPWPSEPSAHPLGQGMAVPWGQGMALIPWAGDASAAPGDGTL